MLAVATAWLSVRTTRVLLAYTGWRGLHTALRAELRGTTAPQMGVLARAVINYENMQYICNYDPTPLDMDRFAVGHEYDRDR